MRALTRFQAWPFGWVTSLALTLVVTSVGFCQNNNRQSRSQSAGEAAFYRGYYLQHQQNDLDGAIKAYKQVAKLGASAETLAAVDAQMQNLQEELATADFAQVMPENALGYVEMTDAGDHVEKIARLMGMTGRDFSAGDDKVTIRIDREIAISSDFQISPSLLRELKKIRGAAVAITNIRENGPPVDGVCVIHPGDSDLVTGILETGVQLVPADENLGGYPTFSIDNEVWIVKTKRLILVGSSKEQVKGCLNRIEDQTIASLADSKLFQSARAANKNSAVFAYVCPEKILSKYSHLFEGEAAIARMVLDLDHMQHVSASLQTTDAGLRARVGVQFAENHASFGYGLIRTIPLTKKALKHIPSGSAAVVGMGLNPKMLLAAQAAGNRQLSALDIGREFFANIEEVGVFVMPTMSTQTRENIPDVGLIIASSDIEKSDELWNQLLSLPAKMELRDGPRASDVKVAGVAARQYTFPGDEIPPIVIARIGEEAMVAGTRNAVEAAMKAQSSGATLANDDRAASFWNTTSEFTSKAAFVNVSRALELAASIDQGRESQQMRMVAGVVPEMAVTLVVNEAPAKFEVQTDVVGLPQLEDVIKAFAKMQGAVSADRPRFSGRMDRAVRVRETAAQPSVSDRVHKEAPVRVKN